jgi:WD40 repeat protein
VNEWVCTPDRYVELVDHINVEDGYVVEIVSGAGGSLKSSTPDKYESFASAIASGRPRAIRAIAESLYNRLLQEEPPLRYESPAKFDPVRRSQTIRTPESIRRTREGTCLDLTLLFLACLGRVGIRPVYIQVAIDNDEDHALAGAFLQHGRQRGQALIGPSRLRRLLCLSGTSDFEQYWKSTDLLVVDATGLARGYPTRSERLPFDEACRGAWETLRNKPDAIRFALDVDAAWEVRGHSRRAEPAAPPFEVPFDRPALEGRATDLMHLHDALQAPPAPKTLLVTGLPGVGKTQLAVRYAHDYRLHYPGGIFWVNAANPSSIIDQLAAFAQKMGLPQPNYAASEEDRNRQQALSWIGAVRGRSDVLIIVDDLQEQKVLTDPPPGIRTADRLLGLQCRLLGTSRRADFLRNRVGVGHLALKVLTQKAARRLLLRESRRENRREPDYVHAVDEVCRLLGHLPLLLRIAGALLGRPGAVDFTEFAGVLQHPGSSDVLLGIIPGADYPESSAAVLSRAWNALPEPQPQLKEILKAIANLRAGDAIPDEVLRWLVELPKPSDPTLADPWPAAIGILVDHNLLQRRKDGSVQLHPLVRHYALSASAREESYRAQLAAGVAKRARQAATFIGKTTEGLLDTASHLRLVQPLASESVELRKLIQVFNLQAHALRLNFDPLPQLALQARMLEDRGLAETIEAIRSSQPGEWFRLRWSGSHRDPDDLRRVAGHIGAITGCAFGKDSRALLSASDDNTLRLWKLEGSRGRAILKGHTAGVTACVVTPSGDIALSASRDRTLRVWDLQSSTWTRVLEGHTDHVNDCAIVPNGNLALSASDDGTVRLWDLSKGQPTNAVIANREVAFTACAMDREGHWAVFGTIDGTLYVWNAIDNIFTLREKVHAGPITACAMTPDGKTAVSGSMDGTVRVWDVGSGSCQHVFKKHKAPVTGCAITQDGQFSFSSSRDRSVWRWDLRTGEGHRLAEAEHWLTTCAIAPDGTAVAAGSDDCSVRLWNAKTGEVVAVLEGHPSWITGCAINARRTAVLSASTDRTLRLWDPDDGNCTRVLIGHAGAVLGCAFAPDSNSVLSASEDTTLCIWTLAADAEPVALHGHNAAVTDCAFTPEGNRAVSTSRDGTALVWSLDRGQWDKVLPHPLGLPVVACAVGPQGHLALSAASDGKLRLWNIEAPRLCTELKGHKDRVTDCVICPEDGTIAVSASWDRTLGVWKLPTGNSLRFLVGHSDGVTGCAMSRIDWIASTSYDKTLRLWDGERGTCRAKLFLGDHLRGIAVASNGELVVCGSMSGHVYCFDFAEPIKR